MILPSFSSNSFIAYERCDKFPTIPIRLVIVGASGNGKSELIKRLKGMKKLSIAKGMVLFDMVVIENIL